jgi:hypothetical protein
VFNPVGDAGSGENRKFMKIGSWEDRSGIGSGISYLPLFSYSSDFAAKIDSVG